MIYPPPIHLWEVHCDNQEPWAEDHNEYTTMVRAATEAEARKLGLAEREHSESDSWPWQAEATILVENIEAKERALDVLPAVVAALNKAFEFEGDVFGVGHNDATDALSEAEAILKTTQP